MDSVILPLLEQQMMLRNVTGFQNREFRLKYRGTRDGTSMQDV